MLLAVFAALSSFPYHETEKRWARIGSDLLTDLGPLKGLRENGMLQSLCIVHTFGGTGGMLIKVRAINH